MKFGYCKGRKLEAEFKGGDITSDAGVLLLRNADRKIKLTERISRVLNDPRVKRKSNHPSLSLLRQRVYAIAMGYEDLNDHFHLREDKLVQAVIGSDQKLASPPSLSRFENWVTRKSLVEITKVLIQVFIESHNEKPKNLILDFDGTDDKVHGNQKGAFFHGYYRHLCFLPLYVFCGNHLLIAYLRPGNVQDSKHSWAILKLLVKELRRHWPEVGITFRGDIAFCRHNIFDWCERNNVKYITGIAGNNRIIERAKPCIDQASILFDETGEKQRIFGEFVYGATTWKKERRVIVRVERNIHRLSTRFVVTNLSTSPKELYEKVYCARGEMENRIKEQQLCLFSGRTSSKNWLANQFRLLLTATAYTLFEAMRRMSLKGTELEKASCSTIRYKLIKLGAVILRNSRKICALLSDSYPWKNLFRLVAIRLVPT